MSALSLIRLQPDGAALAAWAARAGVPAFQDDLGYAVHAATKAVFGDLAPKPFAVRMRNRELEVIGYSAASPADVGRVVDLQSHDETASQAIGLHTMVVKPMPTDWRPGERFSFECRVAPIVRSRRVQAGKVVELDVAHHSLVGPGQQPPSRDAAYAAWLAREFERFGAARLRGYAPFAFRLTSTARRTSGDVGRLAVKGLVPDLVARGELEVASADGMVQLLTRGLGRHRSFGYGCLLLAPRGVLYTGRSPADG